MIKTTFRDVTKKTAIRNKFFIIKSTTKIIEFLKFISIQYNIKLEFKIISVTNLK